MPYFFFLASFFINFVGCLLIKLWKSMSETKTARMKTFYNNHVLSCNFYYCIHLYFHQQKEWRNISYCLVVILMEINLIVYQGITWFLIRLSFTKKKLYHIVSLQKSFSWCEHLKCTWALFQIRMCCGCCFLK
jgi:hypothetical protein